MEFPGRLRIVVATMLVVRWKHHLPGAVSGRSAKATSAPGPSHARDDQAMNEKRASTDSVDLRRPTDFAAFFRSPAETTTPRAPAFKSIIPPPRQFGQASPSIPTGPGHRHRPRIQWLVTSRSDSRPPHWSRPTSVFRSTSPPPCASPSPAADRGRRPGERLGRRSPAHAGQGPLGSRN